MRLRAVEASEEIRQVVTRFFEALRDGGAGEFTCEQPRHIELKGIEGPQKVYPLTVERAEPLVAVD